MIKNISKEDIDDIHDYNELVDALKKGFLSKIETPMRHHHDYENPSQGKNSTLLLMPSWQVSESLGVKIITVSPENAKNNMPAIQGVYLLFDAKTGTPKAMMDGKSLTVKRTSCASALASRYLSREDSKVLLMLGTGALSPELIKAHCSQRPIEKVFVWGRNFEKAQKLADSLNIKSVSILAIENYQEYISQACIISVATLSSVPLIFGKNLHKGQHIDLVGAYKPDMREADDETILKSRVFVDTYQGGLKESGDIAIPLENKIISKDDVLADLFSLCSNEHKGRNNAEEITLFKSVGHALEDLVAANYYYDKLTI